MTLSELFQTLKTLSKADLNSVKQFLESLDYNYNGFENFLLSKKAKNPENFTHISVCPSLGEFSAGKGLHTNGIEGFWAILKRSIIGSYHHVSTKYLQSYVNECCFRQNNRFVDSFDKLLLQSILVA